MNPPPHHAFRGGLAPEDHGEPGHRRAPPVPQDGRIRAVVNRKAQDDLRMSTLPTASGEKCVMRILDNRSINVSLDDPGLSETS